MTDSRGMASLVKNQLTIFLHAYLDSSWILYIVAVFVVNL